jgi:hypothetical protein
MKERNIPPYVMDDYLSISHPSTYRGFKNSLETLHQYTETGLAHIFNGEIGRYESFRFIEQTFIPKGGAANSTTYDPWSGTRRGMGQRPVLLGVLHGRRHRHGGDLHSRGNPREDPGRLRPLEGYRLVLPRRLRPRASRRAQRARHDVGLGDLI